MRNPLGCTSTTTTPPNTNHPPKNKRSVQSVHQLPSATSPDHAVRHTGLLLKKKRLGDSCPSFLFVLCVERTAAHEDSQPSHSRQKRHYVKAITGTASSSSSSYFTACCCAAAYFFTTLQRSTRVCNTCLPFFCCCGLL